MSLVTHPLYRHILQNNNADLLRLTPLYVAGKKLGFMQDVVANVLRASPFVTEKDSALYLKGESFETRNENLRGILKWLIGKKLVTKERFELYDVSENFDHPPLALADRALMPALGFCASGIHCNAYVRTGSAPQSTIPLPLREGLGVGYGIPKNPSGVSGGTYPLLNPPLRGEEIRLWTARRAMNIAVEPGKLDHLVAGGQPHGLSLRDNLAKEAWEEAGIPKQLAEKAEAAGKITYARLEGNSIRRDTLFVFDLELPPDFVPQNQDGEAGNFRLLSPAEVLRLMTDTEEFKFNVPLVLIDFFIRRGLLKNRDGLDELRASLNRPS